MNSDKIYAWIVITVILFIVLGIVWSAYFGKGTWVGEDNSDASNFTLFAAAILAAIYLAIKK